MRTIGVTPKLAYVALVLANAVQCHGSNHLSRQDVPPWVAKALADEQSDEITCKSQDRLQPTIYLNGGKSAMDSLPSKRPTGNKSVRTHGAKDRFCQR